MTIKNHISIMLLALICMGCSAPKKVIYVPEAENIPVEVLSKTTAVSDPVMSPGDLLNIRIYASDMLAVAPFNRDMYITPEGTIGTNNRSTNNSEESSTDYYLVNEAGDIEMPIIGSIHVSGKTKAQVADLIRDAIYPKYVKIEPTVEIRLMNFRVTILGMVNSPGQYTSKNERLNVLEAIALAGDLHIRGERENILLYRTNPDGTREAHRLNLNDRNLLLSPYFNLQQNDILYVVPNASARQSAWQMHQGWTTTIAVVSGLSSVAGLVIGIVNLSK